MSEANGVAPKIVINPDGSQTVVGENGESTLLVPNAPGAGVEENLSPAMRALRELQGEGKPVIERVETGGLVFFAKRLNFAELTKVGLLTPRDKDGQLDLNNSDNLTALTAAMLFCAVVTGEDNKAPFFETFAEAWLWANSPDPAVASIVDALFGKIAEINPSILPAQADEIEVVLEKKESKRTPSTTPPKTSQPSSSSATDSSAAPASSPPAKDN